MTGPFGAGPYRSYDGSQAAETLVEFDRPAGSASRSCPRTALADRLAAAGKFSQRRCHGYRSSAICPAAARQTALAISFLMDQIRQQRKKQPAHDSSRIDL